MDEIVLGLFIGSFEAAQNVELLQKHDIKYILTITDPYFKESKLPIRLPEVTYRYLKIRDENTENIVSFCGSAINFIQMARSQNHNVLIHCMQGRSRSVALACAYLICVTKLPLTKVLSAVQVRRPLAQPNKNFMLQLENFRSSKQAKQEKRNLNQVFGALLHEKTDRQQILVLSKSRC